jgi:hypothetical protein
MADVTAKHGVATTPKDDYSIDDKRTYNISNDGGDDSSIDEEAQVGVKAMEAISVSWSKWSLIAAYIS